MPLTDSFKKTASALLEQLHGQTLDEFIREERELKAGYLQIAKRLRKLTNGAVDVSHMTIRRWLEEAKQEQSEGAA